jgi:hypothetical protein
MLSRLGNIGMTPFRLWVLRFVDLASRLLFERNSPSWPISVAANGVEGKSRKSVRVIQGLVNVPPIHVVLKLPRGRHWID